MLIVCPTCESRYDISAEAVSRGGRAVRCSRCRTEWRVYPESGGDAGLDEAFAGDVEADLADGFEQTDPAVEEPVDAQALEDGLVPAAPSRIIEAEPRVTSTPSPRSLRRVSPRNRKPTPWSKIALAAGLAGVVLLFAGRSVVVRLAPQTASLYAHLGLPVNLRGLSFEEVHTTMLEESGVKVLVVEGLVQSQSTKPAPVPRVRVSLLDDKGAEIYTWTAVVAREALPPGQALPFKTRLASPPAEARSVTVRFLARQDMVTAQR